MTAPAHKRLESLDILRGFDLFLLVFLQPVLTGVLVYVDADWSQAMLYQLTHETWEGFRVWDIVMPLFLFMAGTSMPFSFAKYHGPEGRRRGYRHVLKRFVILFLLGMVVQGNLLAFDPEHIYIYVNTLQAIASGYLISAVIVLNFGIRGRLMSTLILLLLYSIPMSLWGDFTPSGNLANLIDACVLGRFRGDPEYTWVFSSLVFGVTVMLGVFAGMIMRGARAYREKLQAAVRMTVIGLSLVAAGWLWSVETPVVKKIWSGSMTILSGGFCFLLMALFYYLIDCRGVNRGMGWLKIYGMNAITAYILGEVVNFRSVVASISYGLERYLGDFYEAWLTTGSALIVFFILWAMYRNRIFLKI